MQLKTFFIHAKNGERGEEFRERVESFGFEHVEEDPDFIITLGGDGTFLEAERKWSGIPKLLVRDSMICFKCHDEPVEEVLKKIEQGSYQIHEMMKLEAVIEGEALIAVNDVVVRNEEVSRALRFKVEAGDEETDVLIGDGVVVSTPFGSTGYYYSITRHNFDKGIGVAFNNTTEKMDSWNVSEEEEIVLEVVRGKGELAADNNPDVKLLKEGDRVVVRKCGDKARLLTHVH